MKTDIYKEEWRSAEERIYIYKEKNGGQPKKEFIFTKKSSKSVKRVKMTSN